MLVLVRVYALVLPDTLAHPPESVCHQRGGSYEVHAGAEAAGGQIALVLDGAVAAGRRHILRHGELVCCGVNGSVGLGKREVRLRSFAASNRDPDLGAYVMPESGKVCAISTSTKEFHGERRTSISQKLVLLDSARET
jgi:hypothetical protein